MPLPLGSGTRLNIARRPQNHAGVNTEVQRTLSFFRVAHPGRLGLRLRLDLGVHAAMADYDSDDTFFEGLQPDEVSEVASIKLYGKRGNSDTNFYLFLVYILVAFLEIMKFYSCFACLIVSRSRSVLSVFKGQPILCYSFVTNGRSICNLSRLTRYQNSPSLEVSLQSFKEQTTQIFRVCCCDRV